MLFLTSFILVSILQSSISTDEICDRRPLGTKTEPLPPDNQFVLDIEDIKDNQYIPTRQYKDLFFWDLDPRKTNLEKYIHLHSRDRKASFIAFTISLQEDSIVNKANLRKPIYLKAGHLEPSSDNGKPSKVCNNTVVETDITPKTSVEALWTAPGKDNKCVTVFAVVAVKPSVWYSFEGPLSKRVCEDPRQDDDIPPNETDYCQACEDARYLLTFEGLWSYNTHPDMFPRKFGNLARFSDLVGASHKKDFSFFRYNSEASLGLKMLAEQGNTTRLENEIESYLGDRVRTVIKATSPPKPYMSTTTTFRANREHHRLSLATAIQPSPDWFLGVSNLELCNAKTKNWAPTVRLNLYPLDAGTDKGLDFDSANDETSPQQPIAEAIINAEAKVKKPFARLLLTLIRTYKTNYNCTNDATDMGTEDDNDDNGEEEEEEEEEGSEDNEDNGDGDDTEEPEPSEEDDRPSTSESPPSVDPDSSDKCPMSQWDEWLSCEGDCVDGTVQGIQIRQRYHMVDGVAVGKYIERGPVYNDKEVSEYCLENFPTSETRPCEEPCDEEGNEDEEYNDDVPAERLQWNPWRK